MDSDQLKRFLFFALATLSIDRSPSMEGKVIFEQEAFLSNVADTRNFSDNGALTRSFSRCCYLARPRTRPRVPVGRAPSREKHFSRFHPYSLYAHSAGKLDEKFYDRDSTAVNAAQRVSRRISPRIGDGLHRVRFLHSSRPRRPALFHLRRKPALRFRVSVAIVFGLLPVASRVLRLALNFHQWRG